MLKQLHALGMAKNEAKVYEALTISGRSRAGYLINKLDLHRNLVYQSLESLIHKGFVTKISDDGVWQFQITDPHSLLTALKRKEKIAAEVIEEINSYQHKSQQQIVVYEGIESYRRYWLESIARFPKGTIDYTVFAHTDDEWVQAIGEKTYKEYMELRIKKEIVWKTVHFKFGPKEKQLLRSYPNLTEYRLWPRDMKFRGNFNVIHDTVILQAFQKPYRIIEIRDPVFVDVFRNYFDMIWEKSEPVKI